MSRISHWGKGEREIIEWDDLTDSQREKIVDAAIERELRDFLFDFMAVCDSSEDFIREWLDKAMCERGSATLPMWKRLRLMRDDYLLTFAEERGA